LIEGEELFQFKTETIRNLDFHQQKYTKPGQDHLLKNMLDPHS